MNSTRRLRYLIDIIVIALGYFGLDAAADAFPLRDFRIVIVVSTLAKCVFLVLIWFWLLMRGEAVLFIAVYLLERAGFRRDMSAFAAFKGNLEFTLYQLVGIIIGAGFWRRVSVPRFPASVARHSPRRHQSSMGRRVFDPGDTVGLIHAYQNPLGMLLAGSIGLVIGVVFLSTARNLWVPIIAHTLYDTARVIAFYVHGPPPW